jgi:hypothetical protein
MSVWEQEGRYATRTRMVTGAILAPHETQRQMVNGKTGHHSLRRESEPGFVCLLTRAAKWRPLIGHVPLSGRLQGEEIVDPFQTDRGR